MTTTQPIEAPGTTLHVTDTDAVELLRALVAIPSVSGHERPAVEHLVAVMQRMGLHAGIDAAGNAVGHRGDTSPAATEIILLGHIDTVPGNIPVRIDGDTLHGRGSVDAKGPLGAFAVAAARATLPPNVRLVVVGAVEEESATSRGARHIAHTRRPAACIIGEPSHWDGVTLGYKGRLLCEITIERDAAHSACPEENPAEIAADFWQRVRSLRFDSRHNGPDKPAFTSSPSGVFHSVQPSLRAINTNNDGMKERATMTLAWRLPPGVTPHAVEASVCRIAPQGAQLNFTGHELAHAADRSNPVARALTASIRAAGGTPTPRLKTGTSDMNVVASVWQCPIAAYGPGDSNLDHTPIEHISIAEYIRSIEVLTSAIERLASELASVGEARPLPIG